VTGALNVEYIEVGGRRIEVLDLPGDPGRPPLLLLHEGLGSIELWRGLPEDLHNATSLRVVAFSRYGHGRSDPPAEPRTPEFFHDEALRILPELRERLKLAEPVLIGHSDGASIALIHAAHHPVRGLVLLAPHVFVEQVTVDAIEQSLDKAAVRYDRDGDQHYDVISAFIKSVRGSDVDAALHYLARMLVAGEDPRFIARRLMILASEDIGMADPTALQTAVAAAQTVQLIGLPEAQLTLAHATVHLATAPKSNAVTTALGAAMADIKAGKAGLVPPHLRDGHYSGAAALGNAQGYKYSHDDPDGVVPQQYPPDELVGVDYYRPTGHGAEREIAGRLERLRAIIRRKRG